MSREHSTSSLAVREVREADAPAIVELLNPIVEAGKYSILTETFSVDDQVAFQRSLDPRATYLAAFDTSEDELLGIQDIQPASDEAALAHVGEIATFVKLGTHRRGVGGAMANKNFELARERDYRKLVATVRADNETALSFYEALGFKRVGTLRNHVRILGQFLDEVVLECFL